MLRGNVSCGTPTRSITDMMVTLQTVLQQCQPNNYNTYLYNTNWYTYNWYRHRCAANNCYNNGCDASRGYK